MEYITELGNSAEVKTEMLVSNTCSIIDNLPKDVSWGNST